MTEAWEWYKTFLLVGPSSLGLGLIYVAQTLVRGLGLVALISSLAYCILGLLMILGALVIEKRYTCAPREAAKG